MKKILKVRLTRSCARTGILLLMFLITGMVSSQNVSVSGALTGNGSYANLESAFTAINGGSQSAANITVSIIGNTTETTTAVLNEGTWASLIIRPSGGSFTVAGNLASPLIAFNGADNVLLDGVNSGGDALTITNTNTGTLSTVTMLLGGAATNNTVTNATILGASASPTLGTVYLGTATVTGNSNNVFTNNNIGSVSGNFATNAVYSSGTSGSENVGNQFMNNNIYDYFNATDASAGFVLAANSASWNISNNKLYQTAARVYTVAVTHRAIFVNAGNGHTITGNTIGYSSSAKTGTTVMSGTIAVRYVAIELNVGTGAPASVQGNTISAITLSTSSSAGTANGILCGIHVTSGNAMIGTITGNLIGGSSGTGHLQGFPTTTQGMVVGISAATTGSISIYNNMLGGFSSIGNSAAVAGALSGINVSAAAATLAVSGNTIGNATANNMRAGTSGVTTGASQVSGINLPSTPSGTVLISNNVFQNFASYGSGAGYVRGVWTQASSGNTATAYYVTNNLFTNFSTNSTLTSLTNGQAAAVAVNLSTGAFGVVANNTISGISLTGTQASAGFAAGIVNANATSSAIFNNVIYNITNASTNTVVTAPGIAAGIIIRSGTNDVRVVNNMISLGTGSSGNTAFIGIQGNHGSSPNPTVYVYHNSINIAGGATGNQSSFGILRGDLTTTARNIDYDIRNNLITNTRAGGTGAHFAIANNFNVASPSNTGWASDYNVLNANAFTVGHWGAPLSLSQWKPASGGDANSYTAIQVNYVNPVSDLHLNMGVTPTPIESGGQALTGYTLDIDNQVRPGPSGSVNGGATAPDIGADEFDGAPYTCTAVTGGVIAPAAVAGCAGQTLAIASASATSGPGVTYQWQASNTQGGPYTSVTGGTGSTLTTYYTAPLSGGPIYMVLMATCNSSITGYSNEATVTVNALPTATASATGGGACAGSNYTLNGSSDIGTSYSWSGSNGFTSNLQNPVVNATGSGPVTYSLMTSTAACSSGTSAVVTVTVLPTPYVPSLTPPSSTICTAGSLTLTTGKSSFTLNAGTNTNSNTATTYPAPYSVYYGGQRMQFLVTAAELSAAGFVANAQINNLQFPVISFGSNWGTSITNNQGFKVSMGHTNLTALSAFVNTLTTVSGPANFSPVTGYGNTHSFATPFVWDGVNNLIIETAFSNNIAGTTADAVFHYTTATTNVSSIVYRADNVTAAQVYTATTVSLSRSSRPDFRLNGTYVPTLTWTPSAGLSSTTASSVVATPTANTVYTVKITNSNGCSNAATATVVVRTNPTVNVVASSSVTCGGAAVTLTASGALSYSWSSGGSGTTTVVNPLVSTVYTVTGTNSPCAPKTATISIIATPNPTILVSGSTGVCTGNSASLSASGANTYSWSTGDATPTIVTTPSATTVYTVVGTNTLSGCFGSRTHTVTVGPTLTLSVAAPSVLCEGVNGTVTASGASTYTWETGSTTNPRVISPSVTTVYTVTGESGPACSGTAAVTVTVNPKPAVTISGNSVICVGQTTSLTAGGASTYTWNTGSSATVIAVSPSVNTTYSITATSSLGCLGTNTYAVVSNTNPVISIAASGSSVCIGSASTFTASGATSYTWSTGPNTNTMTIVPTAATVYTVTGSNPAGCVASRTVGVGIYQLPTVVITPASATVCSMSAANLTASGASTYTWNGTTTGAAVSLTTAASTVYTVVGTSSQGCQNSATVSVSTNTLPVIGISPPSLTVCSQAPASFTASGANTYTWNGAVQSDTFTGLPVSNTIYTVAGTSAQGCKSSSTVQVSTLALPTVVVTPSLITICPGIASSFTASGADTFTWSTSSTNTVVTLSPSVATQYFVSGTDAQGCTNSAALTILTHSVKPITVSPSAPTICAQAATNFTASGSVTYTWSNGLTGSVVPITPSASAVYTVTGIDANGCVASRTIAVSTLTAPAITISPASPSVCLNSSASFTASGATTYTWNTNAFGPVLLVTPSVSTTYTVTGKNQTCFGTKTVNVHVWQLPSVTASADRDTVCSREVLTLTASGAANYTWLPTGGTGQTYTMTPLATMVYTVLGEDANGCANEDSVIVHVEKCTGLQTFAAANAAMELFPNPSTGLLVAHFNVEGNKQIVITDAVGAVVRQFETESEISHIDLSGEAKGIYFVRLTIGGKTSNHKVVIQ